MLPFALLQLQEPVLLLNIFLVHEVIHPRRRAGRPVIELPLIHFCDRRHGCNSTTLPSELQAISRVVQTQLAVTSQVGQQPFSAILSVVRQLFVTSLLACANISLFSIDCRCSSVNLQDSRSRLVPPALAQPQSRPSYYPSISFNISDLQLHAISTTGKRTITHNPNSTTTHDCSHA